MDFLLNIKNKSTNSQKSEQLLVSEAGDIWVNISINTVELQYWMI